MISYKLAKQLKDASFNQKVDKQSLFYVSDGNIMTQDGVAIRKYFKEKPTWIKIPTLSELIEACGNKFTTLMKATRKDEKEEWWASSTSKEGIGKTPEEAVAKLWLKLNTPG